MQLNFNTGSKIIKPSSEVDMVFKSQGFRKKSKKDTQYYELKMKDSCTRLNYQLQIPIYEVYLKNNREPLYKLQEMAIYLENPLKQQNHIPQVVISAANEKVQEVFSYLNGD